MHNMLHEHKHDIKHFVLEELKEAIEDEDLDDLYKCCHILWMYHDMHDDSLDRAHNPYGNPAYRHLNPGPGVEGTADIKTMSGPHGHGYGTLAFTTKEG